MTSKQIIENNLIAALEAMCEESLSPEVFQEWQHVKDQLINNRHLKEVSAYKKIYERFLRELFEKNSCAVSDFNRNIKFVADVNHLFFLQNYREAVQFMSDNIAGLRIHTETTEEEQKYELKNEDGVFMFGVTNFETDELFMQYIIKQLFEWAQKNGWDAPF